MRLAIPVILSLVALVIGIPVLLFLLAPLGWLVLPPAVIAIWGGARGGRVGWFAFFGAMVVIAIMWVH